MPSYEGKLTAQQLADIVSDLGSLKGSEDLPGASLSAQVTDERMLHADREPQNWLTAADLLFSGGRESHFFALDARTGELLWKTNLGGTVASGPMTYAANGHQYVAVSAE